MFPDWMYVWDGSRVVGPIPPSEFGRLERSFPPEAQVWTSKRGWSEIWTAFSSPIDELTETVADPEGAAPEPPDPPSSVAVSGSPAAPGTSPGKASIPWRVVAAAVTLLLVSMVLVVYLMGRSPKPADLAGQSSIENPDLKGGLSSADSGEGVSLAGTWVGEMDRGRYSFTMTIEEGDGQEDIRARMKQVDRKSGASGTELLRGRWSDGRLRLVGYSWSADTPSGWSLDTITAKVLETPAGLTMIGAYTCASCKGASPIQGRMDAS